MKKINKAFTLIELLAVILILGIIALIAVPVITGLIETAKIGSAEASALSYVEAIDKQIVTGTLKGEENLKDGFYDYDEITVSLKGQIPSSGWIEVKNGQVIDYSFVINGYVVSKEDKTVQGTTVKERPKKTYVLGELVYFDPVSKNKCNETTYTGENTCYKWRVIVADDNSSKTNIVLQMDHNLINEIKWAPDVNTVGPITALTELIKQTKLWTRVEPLSYEYDTTAASSTYGKLSCTNGNCILHGTSIAGIARARMITGEEVRDITNTKVKASNAISKTWTLASSFTDWFYFSNKENVIGTHESGTGNNDLAWLVENTSTNAISGATSNATTNSGYWTLSPVSNNALNAWRIYDDGHLNSTRVQYDSGGVRPVIKISKSNI